MFRSTHPLSTDARVTVIGGPTALIEIAGWTVLTDPTFDPAGSEYQDGPVRLRKTAGPALSPGELPELDVVLVTHTQHRDNLDDAGRTAVAAAPLTLTTPAGARDLGGSARGLEPWSEHVLVAPGRPALTVTAVPARHGPPGTEDVTGPVIGFLLTSADSDAPVVYVSGDTVDVDTMEALAARSPVDVALLHLGAAGFAELGPVRLSLTASDAVDAAQRLGHPFVVAVHAEGWAHYTQRGEDYRRAFDAAGARLLWPRPGEPVALPAPSRAGNVPPTDAVDVVRAFYATVDTRPVVPDAVRAALAVDFRDHDRPAGAPADLSDRDALVALLVGLADGFPDGRHELERVEPVGPDEALVYWRFRGHHTGAPVFGAQPSGARVDFVGTDLFRRAGRLLVEQRHVEDLLTLTRQLTR